MELFGKDILYEYQHTPDFQISSSSIVQAENAIDRNRETYANSANVTIRGINETYDTIYAIAGDVTTFENIPEHVRDRDSIPASSRAQIIANTEDPLSTYVSKSITTPLSTGIWARIGTSTRYVWKAETPSLQQIPSSTASPTTFQMPDTQEINKIYELYLLKKLYNFNEATDDNDLAGIAQVSWSYLERGGGTLELIDGTQTYYEGLRPRQKRTYNVTTDYRSYATVRHLLSLLREHPVFTVIPDFENAPDVIFQATLDREPQIGY